MWKRCMEICGKRENMREIANHSILKETKAKQHNICKMKT